MDYEKQSDLTGKSADVISQVDFEIKERFGCIPKSIMKFKKSKELMNLINFDDSEIGKIEGDATKRGSGFAQKQRYSIYNPDQALFLLDYYTKENWIILDPFMGRATRPLVSLFLNRNYIGFDINQKTVDLNIKLAQEKFPDKLISLNCGDGTNFSISQNVDAIFTCPPYYWGEKYGGEPNDLSHMSQEEFELKINSMFENISKVIKVSNWESVEIHPVIITVGTIRQGRIGILDMDFVFQKIAKQHGFILWDKIFTENNAPGAGFTFRRNFGYKYVTKNYETTLVFTKFEG